MKIFAQFISSLLGGIVLGIIGIFVGSIIGGNFGFPSFGGNVDYEAGGVFFAIVGISLGSLLGIMATKKLQKKQYKYIAISIIITIIISIFIFDYNMSLVIKLIILLMPSIILTVITNSQKFSKTKIKWKTNY